MPAKKNQSNAKKVKNTDYDRWAMNGGGVKPIKSQKSNQGKKK